MKLDKKKVEAILIMYDQGFCKKGLAVKIRNLNKRELVEVLLNRINYECWIKHIGNKDLNYDFERFVSRSIDGWNNA